MSRLVPTPTEATPANVSIDIEAIVRRVLSQLREVEQSEPEVPARSCVVIDQAVCSLEDVRAIGVETTSVVLAARTVITPAARDELRHRGIAVENAATTGPAKASSANIVPGTRAIDLQRDGNVGDGLFSAVKKQATTRGVRLCNKASVTVILSDRPATTAHLRVGADRLVVSINRVDDVPRFLSELSPNVFVLDVMHLHLVSLASAIASIAKPANANSSAPPKVTVAGGLS